MHLSIDITFGEDFILYPEAVRDAAGVSRFSDLKDSQIREFPEISNPLEDKVRKALISNLRDSVRKKERLWIMPMNRDTRISWQDWLPAGVIRQLGPEQEYEGTQIIPMGIAPVPLIEALLQRGNTADMIFLHTALHDLSIRSFSSRIYRKIRAAGIKIVHRSWLVRAMSNPKVIAYLIVFSYSVFRALPVSFVEEFHGSILVLWLIDLITVIPYTWGLISLVTARAFKTRLLALLITILSLMAPYVYFAYYGSGYPPHILAIVGILILSTFILEGYRIWGDYRIKRLLSTKISANS